MKIVQTFISPLLYLIAMVTVWMTANISGYEEFLRTMTKENGFFETLTVFFLFGISIYGIKSLLLNRFNRWFWWATALFSLLTFLAGMEEISWGQQIFHFHSSEFFLKENLQHETNLHNLINANLFSSIIYSTVYTLLVFTPLLCKIFPQLKKRWSLLRYFDIDAHTILVVLFASVFQIYFYNDFGVRMDMVTHLGALGLVGLFLIQKKSTMWLKIHYGWVVVATAISMSVHEIYRFKNMQYEIREMFVVLATLLIFMELIQKEENEKGRMDNR